MRVSEQGRRDRNYGGRRLSAFGAAMVWSVLLMSAATAFAQQGGLGRGVRLHEGDGRPVLQGAGNAPEGQFCYGVMGSVRQSGVYTAGDANLRLADLVEAAGGLIGDASSLAHILRNGHAGLQLVYSPASADRLMPGDLVVFDTKTAHQAVSSGNAHQAAGQPSSAEGGNAGSPSGAATIEVGFLGLFTQQPVVVPLDRRAATLPQVIAALQQSPEVIRHVRIIRMSRSAQPAVNRDGQQQLVKGDVIVFAPGGVDHETLARADAFPALIPIGSPVQTASHSESLANHRTAPASSLTTAAELRVSTPKAPLPTAVELPSPINGPALAEPVRSLDQSALPHFTHRTTASLASRNGGSFAMGSDRVAANQKSPAPGPQFAAAEPVLTAFSDPPSPFYGRTQPANRSRQVAARPTPPRFTRDVGAERSLSRPDVPSRQVGSPSSHHAKIGAGQPTAVVPNPIDHAQSVEKSGFGSRATMLGITVLIIAVICFGASIVWSKLDEDSGASKARSNASAQSQTVLAPRRDQRTLDRLIENSLPFIEEQTTMPDRLDYHGEAVGRRRIRVDARQELKGPHYAKVPLTRPERELATSAREETANSQTDRVDEVAKTSTSAVAPNHPATKLSTQGGLLDRVLMAMEREKRR